MQKYTYRTYPPSNSGVEPWEFEVEQDEGESSLTSDPQSGYPVKRVLQSGHAFDPNLQLAQLKDSQGPEGGCCGGGCGCH